jgi:hypothetical protein
MDLGPTINDTSTSISSSSYSTSMASVNPSSSSSLIYISALPPANSTAPVSVSHKLKHPSGPLQATWLIPVLVVVGVVLGSLSAWFCYGYIVTRRGPRPRASSLEPGPPYVPTYAQADTGYPFADRDMEKIALHGGEQGSPSKHSVHGTKYTRSRSHSSQNWLSRPGSSCSVEPTRLAGGKFGTFAWPAVVSASPPKGYLEHQEDDPFLAQPIHGPPTQFARGISRCSSRCSSPDPLSLLDLDERDDEDLVPYETLRHKSIRRGILERLKFGTLRLGDPGNLTPVQEDLGSVWKRNTTSTFRRARPTHGRADSDLRVDDTKPLERLHLYADSPRKTIDEVKKADDETEWVAGSGFRIVEEHLEAIRQQIRDGDWKADIAMAQKQPEKVSDSRRASPFKRPSLDAPASQDDIYTHIPIRKSPSKASTVLVGRTSTLAEEADLSRVDSSVLPRSPPQIMSPPLESKLLFTPVLPQSGSLYAGVYKKGESLEGKSRSPNAPSKARRRSSPTLPRLSNLKDVSRPPTRLTKPATRPKDAPLPATPPRRAKLSSRRLSAQTSGKQRQGRATPAERFAARQAALTQVEEIISQSWSERDLRGVEPVRSPTMFGACKGASRSMGGGV